MTTTRGALIAALSAVALHGPAPALAKPPQQSPSASTKPAPVAAFKGSITLDVDATDLRRRIVTVRQRIPVQHAGPTTLLYPQWEIAAHAPSISAHRLAGLTIRADGHPLAWTRDPARVHAFAIDVPPGARELQLDFQYLAPLGRDPSATIVDGFVGLSWNRLLLYPAGWPTSALKVQATLTLPEGFKPRAPLQAVSDGPVTRFEMTTLERLLDTPVFASRHVATRELGGRAPVRAHWMAASDAPLQQVQTFDTALQAVRRETEAVFGIPPFTHYDLLIALDDRLPGPGGIEHAESGEVVLPSTLTSAPDDALPVIDVIPHELIHAWNGLWRVPADMAVATPNEPFTGTLLWVYEGQTEFWSRILAARSGLRTVEQTLGALAVDAAMVQSRAGRRWKSLADSTNDPLIQNGAVYWRDWQRREDYYIEGVLFWLDVDARLRRCSSGARGMDDFALAFFNAADRKPGERQRPYRDTDVVTALQGVCPGPWADTLRSKLQTHEDAGLLDGLTAHGWRLVFRDTPTPYFRLNEASEGVLDLSWSAGMTVTASGQVKAVAWEGAAFRAGIVPGTRLKSVNGEPFSADRLTDGIARATASQPLQLGIQVEGQQETVTLAVAGGLRYPALERIEGTPDTLTPLLTARTRQR